MKTHLLVLLLLSATARVNAQTPADSAGSLKPAAPRTAVGVTGLVRDAATQKPVEFATVALLRESDAGLVKATYTDTDGQFSFASVADGRYTVSVSFVGYAPACGARRLRSRLNSRRFGWGPLPWHRSRNSWPKWW